MNDDCSGALEELERYLDDELPAEILDAVRGHIGCCHNCLEKFEFYSDFKRVVADKAKREEIPAELKSRLLACLGDDADG